MRALNNLFPESTHVRLWKLDASPDEAVWGFAREHGFVIVSKDSDFRQRSFLFGFPPKLIWVRLGNCTTDEIEKCLRANLTRINDFGMDTEASLLALDR